VKKNVVGKAKEYAGSGGAMLLPCETEGVVAFFDLDRFHRFTMEHEDSCLYELLFQYYILVGEIVEKAGGTIIKFIGDAGLVFFPIESADACVHAMLALKSKGDRWLKKHGADCEAVVRIHAGSVMLGPLGTELDKRLDIVGRTVNAAACLPSSGFAMSESVFAKLKPQTKKLFTKRSLEVTFVPIK
jgi:class 3 adenylate cyclase